MSKADEEQQPVEVEVEAEEVEQPEKVEGEEQAAATEQEATEDDVVVTIDGETPPQEDKEPAPEWVRDLRKKNREDQRKIRELEAKLQSVTAAEQKPAELGKKPSLEDFDYDTDKYEQALDAWKDRKRDYDAKEAKRKQADEAQKEAWQKKLDDYAKSKTELKVKDFDEAEALIQDSFNQTQQGIVLQGSDNPALLVLALGRNPTKAKELAGITDPVKFAFAVAKLETQLKVTNRKAPPAPERTVKGTAPVSGAVDSTLERLRAEAEKTGDFSKVTAYKRKQRQA